MAKKDKKTKEEKRVEEFFPIDEEDLKSTVLKSEKRPPAKKEELAKMVVEKVNRGSLQDTFAEEQVKPQKAKKYSRKSFKKPKGKINGFNSKSKISSRDFTPSKISLKKGGAELIITEKPQAALKISSALGRADKKTVKGVSYYEVNRNGKEIYVACAVGHLFTLTQKERRTGFPVFDIAWQPNFLARKSDFTKRYYDVILSLAKKAGSITVATDYDVEGEVIGLNIVRHLCGQNDASRMKFSTLTPAELNKAYEDKSSSLDWGQAIAGETRHYLDWMYGINLSRALMSAIKSTGRFRIMSIGRVQGPALNLIVQKEKEIMAFKPKPYWQIFITVKNSHVLELKHIKDIFKKSELSKFDNLRGKIGIAKTEKKKEVLPPNPPFNLTTLQTEAYKFYGITPSKTLQAAQSLYLSGLISYPRTSSQKLPPSIGYKEILEKLALRFKAKHLLKREKPVEGAKTDPAHPSIYPTGEFQELSGDEEKIYSLIVKRFLSLFCEDAVIDKKKISVDVDGLLFTTTGSAISKKAWMEIYPSKLKEVEIPDLKGEVKVINLKVEEKETQPPRRYSPASIISELEKRNLGTKATRSSILETLYDRGYVKDQSIEATSLGISLIETLEKYSPVIIDEKLTRSFEDSMGSIQGAKGGLEDKSKKIIEKAKETITHISKDFEKNEKRIGEELVNATDSLREQLKEQNKLRLCPKCRKGNLIINYSKKTRRYFVACDAYPECKNTYSLPPNGLIKKADKNCEECGYPMVMRLSKGKKPWTFCFNPECETNKARVEEYRKKKEEENNNS